MQHRHDERKRHIALWVAVGGTMAVIVALWVLVLPMQLQDMRFAGVRDAARWGTARGADAAGTTGMSLSDILTQQQKRLEAIERHVNANASAGTATQKIDELRARIEDAGKKNGAAPPTNAPANP